VVVAYRTFQSVAITGLVDEELVGVLPEGLKFIAHNGTCYSCSQEKMRREGRRYGRGVG
jgi:hypothetical protein